MTTATATKKRTARKAAPAKRAPRVKKVLKPTDKQVREWALSSGMTGVQMRGRVSRHLVDLYHANGGKVIEGQARTSVVESEAHAPTLGVGSVLAKANGEERLAVYLVTSPTGDRVVLKPDAVYVEEIIIDDSSMDKIIESLGRLSGLPKSDAKATLVRSLSGRLSELASA